MSSDKIKNLAKQLQGQRREYTADEIVSVASLSRALTNYGLYWDSKDMMNWFLAYLKDVNHPMYKHIKSGDFVCKNMSTDVLGKVARLVHFHKVNIEQCNKQILDKLIDDHVFYKEKEIIIEEVKEVKVQVDIFNPILERYEQALDEMLDSGKLVSVILDGKRNENQQVVNRAIKLKEELSTSEAKECYSQKYRKLLLEFVDGIIKQAEVSKQRKPRISKPKPPSKIVQNMKYLETYKDDNVEIISINPVNIVASYQLILYNVRNKRIHILKAEKGKRLSVSGCQVINVCDKTSYSVTLRKPYMIFDDKNNFDDIVGRIKQLNAKMHPANSRTSRDSVCIVSVKR